MSVTGSSAEATDASADKTTAESSQAGQERRMLSLAPDTVCSWLDRYS